MKQQRSQHTRELVLDAAAAEFLAHGYLGANLSDVADRTGLTKGAVYGHFASKSDIAKALTAQLEQTVQHLIDQSAGDVATSQDRALDRARSLALAVAEELGSGIRSSAALRLVVEEALSRAEAPRPLTALRAFMSSMLKGAADGESGPGRPAAPVLADLVIVLLVGVCYTTPAAVRGAVAPRVLAMWDTLLSPSPAPPGRN